MLCQACKQLEASIHYFESFNGSTKTLNLCEHCARLQGVAGLGFSLMEAVQLAVAEEAAQRGMDGEPLEAEPIEPCVACGMTFADYRHDPSHACPACYDSFASRLQLRKRLQQAESGYEELERRLNRAVAQENFEAAAVLRDQLRAMAALKDRD
jgi:protein arginine kinase activator